MVCSLRMINWMRQMAMPIICANGSAFKRQDSTALCFFLAGRSVGELFFWSLGERRSMSSMGQYTFFPSPLILFYQIQNIWLGADVAYWSWPWLACVYSSLQGPVSLDWSLQVPALSLKSQGHTFCTPHPGNDVQPCCI